MEVLVEVPATVMTRVVVASSVVDSVDVDVVDSVVVDSVVVDSVVVDSVVEVEVVEVEVVLNELEVVGIVALRTGSTMPDCAAASAGIKESKANPLNMLLKDRTVCR